MSLVGKRRGLITWEYLRRQARSRGLLQPPKCGHSVHITKTGKGGLSTIWLSNCLKPSRILQCGARTSISTLLMKRLKIAHWLQLYSSFRNERNVQSRVTRLNTPRHSVLCLYGGILLSFGIHGAVLCESGHAQPAGVSPPTDASGYTPSPIIRNQFSTHPP